MLKAMSSTQRGLLAKLEAIHLVPWQEAEKDVALERSITEALTAQGFRVVQETEVPQFNCIHDLSYKVGTPPGGAHVLAVDMFYSPKSLGSSDRFLTPIRMWEHAALGTTLPDACRALAM
jgi:hypothetical protein